MGRVRTVDAPNIINLRRQAVFFDVCCEHDPPGTLPGERVESIVKLQVWVNRIAAYDPEQAGRKAEKFLTEQRGLRNIRVKRWRYHNSRRAAKGGQSDGTLLT